MRFSLRLLSQQLNKQLWLGHPLHRCLTVEERTEYALVNSFALSDEIHEAMREVSWKPWASKHFFNREAYLGELADAQLFLDNLKLLALEEGGSVRQLEEDFHKLCVTKIEQAIRRNDEGYDGVSSKCPACRRDKSAGQDILGQWVCPCGYNWTEQEDED